jgi:predicted nucleotidyltransferase component of viral defense system
MITKQQLRPLVKRHKMSESVVAREYLQVWFLSKLYSQTGSDQVFFKGGTALHLLYGLPRFSEDLDFTVQMDAEQFEAWFQKLADACGKEAPVGFKQRSSISGSRWLLTGELVDFSYQLHISLDFSFREQVQKPDKLILKTDYPVLFRSYVYCLTQEEILAEKIRALLSRKQGRDLYDLWYLVSQGVQPDQQLIEAKLAYYGLKDYQTLLSNQLEKFTEQDFVQDLRPFVPISERETLAHLYTYVQDFLQTHLLQS